MSKNPRVQSEHVLTISLIFVYCLHAAVYKPSTTGENKNPEMGQTTNFRFLVVLALVHLSASQDTTCQDIDSLQIDSWHLHYVYNDSIESIADTFTDRHEKHQQTSNLILTFQFLNYFRFSN